MKLTLSWLKEHLDTQASLEDISKTLTSIGLEVDQITDRSTTLRGFKIVEVLDVSPHPDAEKLKIVKIHTGKEEISLVCGASNVEKNMKAVLASEGMTIPANGLKLKKTMIRGVESCGMLCSEEELCLTKEESEGIIKLPMTAPTGTEYAEYMGLDDPIIEIGLTPDRADCAGIRGIARDLAAAGLGTLKPSPYDSLPQPSRGYLSKINIEITNQASKGCLFFAGCTIKNVKNGPSPEWLKRKLESIGLRPISALVDITNLLTYDQSRPLHVFDADKIHGQKLVIDLAQKGQKMKALNEKDYEMQGSEIIIKDDMHVQSLAGIIGGFDTGCQDSTTNVFLECALFDPLTITYAGRAHMIDSDARYRFERGVDPASVMTGIEQATKLIISICGGEASQIVTAGTLPQHQDKASFTYDPLLPKNLIGLDVEQERQRKILCELGFSGDMSSTIWTITPPSFRFDIECPQDIAEEVVRIIGFDQIPEHMPHYPKATNFVALNPFQKRRSMIRRHLATRGLNETVTWSFMSDQKAELFGQIEPNLRIANPISSDLNIMRATIISNLLEAAQNNMARGQANLSLFEIGPIFSEQHPDRQKQVVTGLRCGQKITKNWQHSEKEVDAFDIKADLYSTLSLIGFPTDRLQIAQGQAPSYYHPGRSAKITLGPTLIGYFGEIHPSIRKKYDVSTACVAFELFCDDLPVAKEKGTTKPALQISPFQPVKRDLAFILDQDITSDLVVRAAQKAEKKYLSNIHIFDVYQGTHLPEGKKSIALSLTLQPTEKTMNDSEIEEIVGRIISSIQTETKGQLRDK